MFPLAPIPGRELWARRPALHWRLTGKQDSKHCASIILPLVAICPISLGLSNSQFSTGKRLCISNHDAQPPALPRHPVMEVFHMRFPRRDLFLTQWTISGGPMGYSPFLWLFFDRKVERLFRLGRCCRSIFPRCLESPVG